MITSTLSAPVSKSRPPAAPPQGELLRLLAAAVVSRSFRELLLREPLTAVRQGYHGEQFVLSLEELDILLAVQADTLQDFARQLQAGRERVRARGLAHRHTASRPQVPSVMVPIPQLAGAD